MQILHRLEAYSPPAAGAVVTIGNFDGVHLGHAQIVATGRRLAEQVGAAVVAITFEPHPSSVLSPEKTPARLTRLSERLALLAPAGVETAVVLHSEPALFEQSAEHFLRRVVRQCRPRAFVEGANFFFGKGRRGDVRTLEAHAGESGYELHVVAPVSCTALPGAPAVSSSAIRTALAAGRVDEAAAMLGRPHRISGAVIDGARRGRTIGFPTANLGAVEQMTPAEAVYAGVAQFEFGGLAPAAINIGPQPTFGGGEVRIEAHILDFAGDLYGRRLGLHFLKRLRGQMKFAGADELVAQIARDIDAVRALEPQVDALRAAGVIDL
ncbi:MAG: riboflavin biosynthesis protein RibF [Phycisphaerae bacterium]